MMIFMNISQFRNLLLNVYILLSPWLAASAPTGSAQWSDTTIPNGGWTNASLSTLQNPTSLETISNLSLNTTSVVTTPSTPTMLPTIQPLAPPVNYTVLVSTNVTMTRVVFATSTAASSTSSSSLALEQNGSSVTTPASSTSHDLPSSATQSSIATFAPPGVPSNADMAKLAEIIVPSVIGGIGVGTALWKFLGLLAKQWPGETAASVARSLQEAKRVELLDKLSARQRAWDLHLERSILKEAATNSEILSEDQMMAIRSQELWQAVLNNEAGPPPKWPSVTEWPPDGPPVPDTPSVPKPPSVPEPPSVPNPPSLPEPCLAGPFCIDWGFFGGGDSPSNPNPAPGQNPPSTPNPPSNPVPPSDSIPPFTPPPGSEPPPPASEESIRLANELPPLPKAMPMWGRFEGLGPVRMVPEAYRTLPLEAKVVYANKYGEDVWSQRLRYFTDAQTAAVDADNKPLTDWNFDRNGDLVDYKGKTAGDLKKGKLPKGVDGKKLGKEYRRVHFEIDKLQDMEEVERERAASEDSSPPTPQDPPPKHTPIPEPTPTPPEPTPPPPEPTAAPPEDHNDRHDRKNRHKHHHKHTHKIERPKHGVDCIYFWNWLKC